MDRIAELIERTAAVPGTNTQGELHEIAEYIGALRERLADAERALADCQASKHPLTDRLHRRTDTDAQEGTDHGQ